MIQKGTDLNIAYLDGDDEWHFFGYAKGASLTRNRKMIETSNSISGTDSTFIAGRKTWTMTCSCLLATDYEEINSMYENGDRIDVKLCSMTDESIKEQKGQAYIKSLKLIGNIHDVAQLNIELQGTGALTYS